jgi:hypothetical protein
MHYDDVSRDHLAPNHATNSWEVDCTLIDAWLASLDRTSSELVTSMVRDLSMMGPALPYQGVRPIKGSTGRTLLYEWSYDFSTVTCISILYGWDETETAVLLDGQVGLGMWSRDDIDAALWMMYVHELEVEHDETSKPVLVGCR